MEMKPRVQLCIDMSAWSIVVILRFEHIQVKEDIVRIMTQIHREGRRSFQRSKNGRARRVATY